MSAVESGAVSGRPGAVSGRRGGRRPGESGTRDSILAAARDTFGAAGFDGTSVRAVARAAAVDPSLVIHFFGSKQGLFTAALQPPDELPALLARALQGDPEGVGERVVRFYLDFWESPVTSTRAHAVLRSAVVHEQAADVLREFIEDRLLGVLAEADLVRTDNRRLRLSLVGSQLVGVALMRYVVRVGELPTADREQVVAAVAPTVQRYLTGDLGGEPGTEG